MDLNLLIAFTGGVVSFFAPCVVPLLPAYIGYIAGVSLSEYAFSKNLSLYRRQILFSSLSYILGFSLIFVLLGTTAASFGLWLRQSGVWMERVGGVLIMVFALQFMGVLRLPFLSLGHSLRLPRWADHLSYGRAFLLGIVFATAWTPCVGAVLGSILTLAATASTASAGALMLFVYSLGISLPFLFVSLVLAEVPGFLRGYAHFLSLLSKLSGVLLFLIGFLLFNNTVLFLSDRLTYGYLNSYLFGWAFRLGYQIR